MNDSYQTFQMNDFERSGDSRLIDIDYLQEMFELEVCSQKDQQIVITLREKPEHFTERQWLASQNSLQSSD